MTIPSQNNKIFKATNPLKFWFFYFQSAPSITSWEKKKTTHQQPNNQSKSQQKNHFVPKILQSIRFNPPMDRDVLFVLRKTEKMRIWYVNWVDPNQQKYFKFSL